MLYENGWYHIVATMLGVNESMETPPPENILTANQI